MPNNQTIFDRLRENGWRQTAVELVGGQWYAGRNERIAHLLDVAYQRGPALVPTTELARRVTEIDPQLVDLLARQQGWQIISGMEAGMRLRFTEQDRLRAVWEARYYYHYDVQMGSAVDAWTDFGFGQSVKIVPVDEAAKVAWQAFEHNPRNKPLLKQSKLAENSNQIIQDGELFFEFTSSGVDGETVIRRVLTEEIINILYEDDDSDVPLFYVRKTNDGNVYYPDWEAKRSFADILDAQWQRMIDSGKVPCDAKRADVIAGAEQFSIGGKQQTRPITDCVMQHVKLNDTGGRGWPQLRRAIAWVNALREFLEDRATVAKAVAAFVDEVIVDQGSRGIDAVKAKFNTSISGTTDWWERNPPPATGSNLIHNKAVDYKRRPLTTGASDAEADAMLMVGQVSSGTKLPPHWMGFPGAMQNRATARESSRPFLEQMQRYQTFWVYVFQEWVEIVLWFAELYAGASFASAESVITLESPLDLEMENVTALMAQIITAMEKGLVGNDLGRLALERLIMMGLEDLGVRTLEPVDLEGIDLDRGNDEPNNQGETPPTEPGQGTDHGVELSATLQAVSDTMRRNALREVLWTLQVALDRQEDVANNGQQAEGSAR